MLSLPPALFLVMLELTVGSFVSLYFLDVRGDTSRGFVVFQGVLYVIFAVLTLLAMNAFASPAIVHGRGLDEAWLDAQGPLMVAFLLLMIPWNVLLWLDRQPRPARGKAAREATPARPTRLRLARFVVGGLTALTGAAALFVVGMAYRTLASSRLDGAFVVATFLLGGIALGGVMTAMLLGHWYLNTPTASGKPLEFATISRWPRWPWNCSSRWSSGRAPRTRRLRRSLSRRAPRLLQARMASSSARRPLRRGRPRRPTRRRARRR